MNLSKYGQKQKAFTLVELLIVIVVIAILAAISVVAYNGVQDRARTSAVHSDLVDFKKRVMLFNVENSRYPSGNSDLAASGVRISSASNYDARPEYNNFYYCADLANNQFALGARVGNSQAASYYITSSSDVTFRSGLISQSSTCSLLGLSGTGSAQGAFSNSGISSTGNVSSWLQAGG